MDAFTQGQQAGSEAYFLGAGAAYKERNGKVVHARTNRPVEPGLEQYAQGYVNGYNNAEATL